MKMIKKCNKMARIQVHTLLTQFNKHLTLTALANNKARMQLK